ncbi:uncharacterized protein LOC120508785 isoform X2 [Passer montanus]|uniref:uncharacterized protein LOC120508785 isoform X2 n=1 Tax=Passer montanus TaxID=9160 RepID=UPI0019606B1F|nr:uncharacterized protein LOC120508785 isoform X2 [Passer montanus]
MEPRELSPALLQPQVTVVATLAELLAAAPGENETPLVSPRCHLERFATELRVTLSRTAGTCWHHSVASNDGDAATSLSQALAAYGSMARSSRKRVAMVAVVWYMAVRGLGDSWARLARKASKLRRACGDAATRMDTRMDTKGDTKAATARARRLQDEAARDGTAQENVVEQGQALSREEGAEVVAGHEARVAASEATTATMERQRLEVTLGLLERLVAACDEAAALPRQLQHLLRDIEAALEGTNDPSPEVPKDLVAKVAEAERLWEANTCLAEDHLLGAVGDIIEFCINGGRSGPSGVAERCQRAIEDIPRLLRLPECPQGVPKVSAASVDPQEGSCTWPWRASPISSPSPWTTLASPGGTARMSLPSPWAGSWLPTRAPQGSPGTM